MGRGAGAEELLSEGGVLEVLTDADQVIVLNSLGELVALSPQTGERTGSLDLKDPVYLEPISVGDKVFVLTDDARLIAIR